MGVNMKRISAFLGEIIWDRIYLSLKIKLSNQSYITDENISFYLINEESDAVAKFEIIDYTERIYYIKLNVTNSGINRCINNGTYKILISDENLFFGIVEFNGEEKYLESSSACFRYRKSEGAYTVTFMINEYTDRPILELLFYNMNKANLGYIEEVSLKKDKPNYYRFIKKVIKVFRRNKQKYIKRAYLFLRKIFHNKKNRNILFLSEQDDKLALNMQSIYQRLMDRGLNKHFKILFSLRKKTSSEVSLYSSIKFLYFLSIADIILIDDHVPAFDWLRLKDDTKLIQIWHAGAGFKGVGYSRWGHYGCPGPFSCHRQYTYCISGSEKISHFFSEQFGILKEQVIPTGMPRMDSFLNKDNMQTVIDRLYKTYPFFEKRKIILFAPTYRGQNRKNAYYPYEKIDFEKLFEYCKSSNSIVLFKMHPWVSNNIPIDEKYSECFFDFNKYPNINDLFYVTDVLITDYSSSMYEYALLNKPMLAYVFDKVQYSSTRGFHRAYDENVPGKVCETFNELLEALYNNDYQYHKHEKYMHNHFDYVDTNNSDRVIDWLLLDKLPIKYKEKLDIKKKNIQEIRSKSFKSLFEEIDI